MISIRVVRRITLMSILIAIALTGILAAIIVTITRSTRAHRQSLTPLSDRNTVAAEHCSQAFVMCG